MDRTTRNLKQLALATSLLLAFAAASGLQAQQDASKAQNPPEPRPLAEGQRGRWPAEEPGSRLMGTITTVGVDRFEIKGRDGTAQTVMVNAQTHYRQNKKDIQLEDLKAGDRVFVRGETNDNKEFVAAAVTRITDEDVQRMQQMQGHRAFGEITAIQGNQLKIRNRRQGEKTVVVNDQTTFTKDGATIALKDLKLGDRILAVGDEANGQFAATKVMTGQLQPGPGQWSPNDQTH